jgi:hypothetical protein
MDFEKAARPEVNVRNFRSALFTVKVDRVTVGGTVRVSIKSAFFTSATHYYVFNPNQPAPWTDSEAENISLPQRVQELVVTVADGGPLDADGAADGRIALIGGPRDSFWGYAVGTLFIRFFGIFIVLSVLMLGMIISGMIFKRLETARLRAAAAARQDLSSKGAPVAEAVPSPRMAAAVALALHLHLGKSPPAEASGPVDMSSSPWVLQGRWQQMRDRLASRG